MKKKPVFLGANEEKKFLAIDLVPGEVFSEEYAHYLLDVQNFNFKQLDERAKLFDKKAIKEFLVSHDISISVEEFITLYNLQSYIHMMWPEHGKNRANREYEFKKDNFTKSNPMPLSQAFERKIAACVECSLLAQLYLQHCGIESIFCCGSAFLTNNHKIEFGGGAHAYLIVRLSGRKYFYDPANPFVDAKDMPNIPAIMSYAKISAKDREDFNKLLDMSVADGGGFAYLEANDVYGAGRNWLYGFESDDEKNRVWRRRDKSGVKRQVLQSPQQVYQTPGRGM